MKILHVGDIAFVGSNLCRELRKRGHDAHILSKAGGPLRNLTDPWITYRKNWLDELNLCGVDPEKYDVIHDHYLINWGSLGLRLKRPKKTVVLHCHGLDIYPPTIIHRFIQRKVAQQSRFLLYSTPDLLKDIRWFKGRCIYLPNPVEISDADTSVEKYADRILVFGTLYRFKKLQTLLPALAKLPFRCDLIDVGPDRHYFKKIAPANVHFMAPFKRSEVNRELSKYQLVIGVSQDGTLRVSELDAMALGIPTLFPFRYDNFYAEALPMPADWKENIGKYFADHDLGEKQRQWVKRYHRAETVVDELLRIYQRTGN